MDLIVISKVHNAENVLIEQVFTPLFVQSNKSPNFRDIISQEIKDGSFKIQCKSLQGLTGYCDRGELFEW